MKNKVKRRGGNNVILKILGSSYTAAVMYNGPTKEPRKFGRLLTK